MRTDIPGTGATNTTETRAQSLPSAGSDGGFAIFAALLTPFTSEGGVDLAALRGHVGHLVAEGVEGFLVCGTTGEGPLLEDEEVALVTETVAATCGERSFVTTQIGRPSTAASIRLLGLAAAAGADGVTAVAPYYYALDDMQLEGHYRSILTAAGEVPVFAYNIPSHAGNDLGPELVRQLASLGLAGIKDSTKSLERHHEYQRIAAELPTGFRVFMGSDGLALGALKAGSSGIVSAVANIRPDLLVGLRAAFERGRTEEAERAQKAIKDLRESLGRRGTQASLKATVADGLVAHGVSYPTRLRPPLGPGGP